MSGKCPVCGAPMKNETCEYCGYVEKKAESVNQSANSSQQTVNPQIIINNNQSNYQQNNYQNNNAFTPPKVSPKSGLTALILCLLLGWFGIHRFYVGKSGTGILYLITGGLFGIGVFVDAFRILTNSFKDNMGLPLKL